MSDYSDMGSVDLFGLDEFGQVAGDPMQMHIGAGVGAAAQAAVTTMLKAKTKSAKMYQFAELIGAGVGAAAGVGVGFVKKDWKAGGMAAAISAVAGGLTRFAAEKVLAKELAANALQMTAGAAVPTAGWGMATVGPQYLVNGGLGIAAIEPSATVQGGLAGPPQLVGGNYGLGDNAAAQQVQLQGGPVISGLGTHFGSTLFNQ